MYMKVFSLILFTVMSFISNAQNQGADSLKHLLEKAPADTNRVELLLNTAEIYFFSKPDSCLFFFRKSP